MYSRLGKKERLRATSTQSTQERNAEKARNEEKPKLFEFVLIKSDFSDDKESIDVLILEEKLIVLCGFIEIVKTATWEGHLPKIPTCIRHHLIEFVQIAGG